MQSKTWASVSAFVVWALAVGSAVAWGLQWSGQLPGASLGGRMSSVSLLPSNDGALVDPGAVGRLLGAVEAPAAPPATPTLASRMGLLGAISGDDSAAALIAIDGKPPKPYRVGSTVADGLVLIAVTPRRAELGPSVGGPVTVTLDMPAAKDAGSAKR